MNYDDLKRMTGREFNIYIQKLCDEKDAQRKERKKQRKSINNLLYEVQRKSIARRNYDRSV